MFQALLNDRKLVLQFISKVAVIAEKCRKGGRMWNVASEPPAPKMPDLTSPRHKSVILSKCISSPSVTETGDVGGFNSQPPKKIEAKMNNRELLTSEILLTDDQLKAIGCLTVEVSRLEFLLDDFIQAFCRFNDIQKEMFIGKWMIGVKIEATRDLFRPRLRAKEKLQSFDTLFAKLKDLITRRNTIVHGEWAASQMYNALTYPPVRRTDAIAKHRKKKLTIKATEIMDIVLSLSECRDELFSIYYRDLILKRAKVSLRKSLLYPKEKR